MNARPDNSVRRRGRLWRDQGGEATVEYVLLLAGVGLPIYALLRLLLSMLSAHYQMLTFIETLPLP